MEALAREAAEAGDLLQCALALKALGRSYAHVALSTSERRYVDRLTAEECRARSERATR